MEIKQHLIDTFKYNDHANKLALAKINEIPEKDECIKFFSHLINSMNKWLARIRSAPGYQDLDWWEPKYSLDELEPKWDECLKAWIELLESKTDEELEKEVEWNNPQATANYTAEIKDIALQLNYHSIQHRSQIQYLIRQQGVAPDFVDYIGTKWRKVS